VSPDRSPDLSAQQSERIDALKATMAELPHELRTALLLYEYENLTYREIATIVGCSEKGVESRLVRARTLLRKKLSRLLEIEPIPKPVLIPQRG
jgi:RNA polymerase sigma-70 factor (ECF subfamily)